MAALDPDGTIVAHNRAFARFICGDPGAALAGTGVLATSLAELYPELEAALVEVAREGAIFRVPLELPAADGNSARIALHLVPGNEEGGLVQLYVHSLG
jgi:PAS domain-containing protein